VQDTGTDVYGRLMGLDPADVRAAMAARVGPTFADQVLGAAGGTGWHDPSLTDRDRALVTLTALVALGVGADRLDSHVDVARAAGVSDEGLTTLLLLLAHYLGYPRCSTAMEAVRR
jgi:4-carboxymuconolactone decarboxylase